MVPHPIGAAMPTVVADRTARNCDRPHVSKRSRASRHHDRRRQQGHV